jgi:hypothetical protein
VSDAGGTPSGEKMPQWGTVAVGIDGKLGANSVELDSIGELSLLFPDRTKFPQSGLIELR